MAELVRVGVSSRLKSHADQQRLCRRLVQLTFVFFVPAVIVRRAIGAKVPRTPAGAPLSIFAQARASASAVVPFIFMG